MLRSMGTGAGVRCVKVKFKCLDFMVLLLTIIAAILVIVLGATILREYLLAKMFHEANCSVQDVEMNPKYDSRDCQNCRGKTCVDSSFPCVYVRVEYTSKSTPDGEKSGLLHTDVVQLRGSNPECSMTVCEDKWEKNLQIVTNFAQKYKDYQKDETIFSCFYSPDNMHEVIAVKTFSFQAALHAMLWSSLAFVGFGSFFIFRVVTRRAFVPLDNDTSPYRKGRGEVIR